jgi:hypothetical protein
MNIENRIAHLKEKHQILDNQIDEMAKHSIPKDADIERLKKHRLQLRDEIVILEQRHKDQK